MEFFSWREFRNRRQVGGLSGLAATPYDSGNQSRDQGISKAGNSPVRAMAIEMCALRVSYGSVGAPLCRTLCL